MCLASMLMVRYVTLPVFWMSSFEVFGRRITLKGMPFSADLLPISTFFFVLGHLLKAHVRQQQFRWPALLMAGFVMVWLQWLYHPTVGLFGREYSHLFASTAVALTGITAMLELSLALCAFPRLATALSHCGTNSLLILLFHSPLQSLALRALAQVEGLPEAGVAAAGLLVSVLGSFSIAAFIRRHSLLSACLLPRKTRRALPVHGARTTTPLIAAEMPGPPAPFAEDPPHAAHAPVR